MVFIPVWEFPGQLVWHTSLTYLAKIQNALVPHVGSKPASTHVTHLTHTANQRVIPQNIAM